MTCPFLSDERICSIASEIAGESVIAKEDACAACTKCSAPHTQNYVTASLAGGVFLKSEHTKRKVFSPEMKRLLSIGRKVPPISFDEGPGTELKKLLIHLKIAPNKDCGCAETIRMMNQWGSAGCRIEYNIQIIISRMEESAKGRGWHWWVSPIAARGLILIACDLSDGLSWTVALLRLPMGMIGL